MKIRVKNQNQLYQQYYIYCQHSGFPIALNLILESIFKLVLGKVRERNTTLKTC